MMSFDQFVEARAQLGDVSDHPLYGAGVPLDSSNPEAMVDQMLNAMRRRLTLNSTIAQVKELINYNAGVVNQKFGPQAGQDFWRKAQELVANLISTH
jgi:hypothetical protein